MSSVISDVVRRSASLSSCGPIAVLLIWLCVSAIVATSPLRAQTAYRHLSLGYEGATPLARLTCWTDVGGWLLAAPNVGVEWDLGDPARLDTRSLSFGVRLDPDAWRELGLGQGGGRHLRRWAAQSQYRWHLSPHRHPEQRLGRWYVGALLHGGNRHDLWAAGLAAGYDRPMVSYGGRHHLELQLGGTLAVGPSVRPWAELQLVLAYRTLSIRRKYWRPDLERYVRAEASNREARRRMDSLVERMQGDPLCLDVAGVGQDSLLAEEVGLPRIRAAFARRYGREGLEAGRIEALSGNTPLPITLPSEHCLVRYRLPLAPTEYDGEAGEEEYLLPFRVRLRGYAEAVRRMQQLNDSLRQRLLRAGQRLPVVRLEPVDGDSMAEAATPQQVLALFDAACPSQPVRPEEVTGYYFRQEGEFVRIDPKQMCRRGTYAVSLRFHPQVEEGYDSLVMRFGIVPRINERDQRMYDRHREALGRERVFLHRRWMNGQEGSVSADQLVAALDSMGWDGYEPSQLHCDETTGMGRHLAMVSYGPALPQLPLEYVVEDSVGLRQGARLYEALAMGVDTRHATWSMRLGLDPHGPLMMTDDRRALLDSIALYLAHIDPELRGMRIEEEWVEDYQYTGLHEMKPGTAHGSHQADAPDGADSALCQVEAERGGRMVWTVLRFRYRLLYGDGRPRIAGANVAYRLWLTNE